MKKKILKKIPRVVIVGAGFGGLEAARRLAKSEVEVTLVDRNNYHLFQPLLYQVATAALSTGDIARPIRSILKKQANAQVFLGSVTAIDLKARRVHFADSDLDYDYLILAPGARYNYFGHEDWEQIAPGLKTVEDALQIRRKILSAFEQAEIETDAARQRAWLNFVVVGGGPTGVELAGSIAELAHKVLVSDFRRIDSTSAKILLLEAGPRILAAFDPRLSERAAQALRNLKVDVEVGAAIQKITEEGVWLGEKFLPSKTVLWAAGVKASPLLERLGIPLDRLGRAAVLPDLSLPEHPEVFVIGDAAFLEQAGQALPGVAPVAKQQGAYVADLLRHRVLGKPFDRPFLYRDKGNMATVGRVFAIAEIGDLKISGFVGWMVWLVIHIFYLMGMQNRARVLLQWAWHYFTFERGARVIGPPRS